MDTTTTPLTDGPEADRRSVLVVDDDESIVDLYAGFLEDCCAVRTARGGAEALAVVDETVDVVLLDRRMPDVSGDEVLAAIRGRNLGCRVAMVTAVDPDLDVIDLPFDDYVVKPAGRTELVETVERLVLLETRDELEYELGQLRVKRNVLRAEMARSELADSEEFAELEARIEALQERLSELRSRLADDRVRARGAA